jgi:hypothetical protein
LELTSDERKSEKTLQCVSRMTKSVIIRYWKARLEATVLITLLNLSRQTKIGASFGVA